MTQLLISSIPSLCAHPASVRRLLALPRKCHQHGSRRMALVPGRSMWSFDDRDDHTSSLWPYNAVTPSGISVAQLPLSQQSLNMAFHVLDKDKDGLISAAEAYKMVAFYLALQDHKSAAPAAERPLSWDQHLLACVRTARKLAGKRWLATAEALESFVAAKMAGGLQKSPPRCSDLVWAGLGMGVTMFILGMLVAAAKTWPIVGPWHQQGLPLLLGSFGTFAILLFGKPEAEAVRLWPLIAGQLGATAIVVSIIKVWGANLLSRAAAMAATVMYMMWTDTIHPPGGALVLMAMGDHTIQQFGWLYMLWPSLLLCLGVMLPISAATNWLRRTHQFDWPGQATAAAASLHQKQQEWEQQQLKKDELFQRSAATVLSDRMAVARDVPMSSKFIQALQRMLEAQSTPQGLSKQQQMEQVQLQQQDDASWKQAMDDLRQRMITPQPRSPEGSSGGVPPDNRPPEQQQQQLCSEIRPTTQESSSSSSRVQTPSNAAELDAAVRRRLRREADRQLEDVEHREAIWGPALPMLKEFERKLQKLHEQRLKQKRQQPVQPPQQMKAGRGVLEMGVDDVMDSNGSSFDARFSEERQQRYAWQQQSGVSGRQRPAWMYRWRSDISTKPGVGDWDDFAPDDN